MKDYIITRITESDDDMKHYGVRGMKWGHRKFYQRNGKLKDKYQSQVDAYKTLQKKQTRAYNEGNKLIKSNKNMKKALVSMDQVDDDESVALYAQSNKLNYDKYWNAVTDSKKYYASNKKAINKGAKIVKKLGLE